MRRINAVRPNRGHRRPYGRRGQGRRQPRLLIEGIASDVDLLGDRDGPVRW